MLTVPAGDLGTVFHVIPYALEERARAVAEAHDGPRRSDARDAPARCTAQANGRCECEAPFEEVKDGAIGVSGGEAVGERDFNVSRLHPIEFEVAVRTEPNLAPLRSELVDNCWYAFKQDHQRSKFDLEMDVSAAAARPPRSLRLGDAPAPRRSPRRGGCGDERAATAAALRARANRCRPIRGVERDSDAGVGLVSATRPFAPPSVEDPHAQLRVEPLDSGRVHRVRAGRPTSCSRC